MPGHDLQLRVPILEPSQVAVLSDPPHRSLGAHHQHRVNAAALEQRGQRPQVGSPPDADEGRSERDLERLPALPPIAAELEHARLRATAGMRRVPGEAREDPLGRVGDELLARRLAVLLDHVVKAMLEVDPPAVPAVSRIDLEVDREDAVGRFPSVQLLEQRPALGDHAGATSSSGPSIPFPTLFTFGLAGIPSIRRASSGTHIETASSAVSSGLSQAASASGPSRMTGIRLWTLPTTSFGVVVMMVAL